LTAGRSHVLAVTARAVLHVGKRQLERSVSWTGPERLRCLWYRLRLTVRDMNDASRRMVELQAPWIR
jgi:hypothetical protein